MGNKTWISLVLVALCACDDGESGDEQQPDLSIAADAALDRGAPDALALDGALPDMMPPDMAPPPRPYPAADEWTPNRGPGGPARAFGPEELFQNCTFVDVGPDDRTDHRNTVTMYDGYLLMPWAPEFGRSGGLTFFDISDPCAPEVVGHTYTELMRETHTIGFSHIGGAWTVTTHSELLVHGGLLFWDISDSSAPAVVGQIKFEDHRYPDAYARVVLSAFWQAPYVYVGGSDNGVYIVDAEDPRNPTLVNQYRFEPTLRAGQVKVIGNLLAVTSAEGTRSVLLDISDPAHPQPIPGGDFLTLDTDGNPREAYFANMGDGRLYYARKEGGGGLFVYDIHDPSNPTKIGDYQSDGNGGYVFVKGDHAFTGESNFAVMYDISDIGDIQEVARMDLEGDLDTATPIGNVVVLSVDDKAVVDQGTAVAPFAEMPDAEPPVVTWVWPADGATHLPLTSRIGVSFDEFVDARSAWAGSVRVYEQGSDPALTRVDGHISTQERIVNFWPVEPLKPGTTYVFEVTAGGVVDFNGNAIAETFTSTFTTVDQ